MSEQNVELVRQAYDAFARRDFDWLIEHADPEIEVAEPAEQPGSTTYHGHEGLLAAIENWAGQFADFELEVEQAIDAGDRVVSIVRQHARGELSGADVATRVAYVHTVRSGKVVRWQMFFSPEEALAAAGATGT